MIYTNVFPRLVALILTIYLLISSILDYRAFKSAIITSRPIEYKIYDIYSSGGRSGGYTMEFYYKGEIQSVLISSKQYFSIIDTKSPVVEVYYCLNRNDFCTQYLLEQSYRDYNFWSVFSFLIIFPWEFLSEKNWKNKRKKWETFWSWF